MSADQLREVFPELDALLAGESDRIRSEPVCIDDGEPWVAWLVHASGGLHLLVPVREVSRSQEIAGALISSAYNALLHWPSMACYHFDPSRLQLVLRISLPHWPDEEQLSLHLFGALEVLVAEAPVALALATNALVLDADDATPE